MCAKKVFSTFSAIANKKICTKGQLISESRKQKNFIVLNIIKLVFMYFYRFYGPLFVGFLRLGQKSVKFIYSEKATKGNRIIRYGCRNVTGFHVFQDRILKLSG